MQKKKNGEPQRYSWGRQKKKKNGEPQSKAGERRRRRRRRKRRRILEI